MERAEGGFDPPSKKDGVPLFPVSEQSPLSERVPTLHSLEPASCSAVAAMEYMRTYERVGGNYGPFSIVSWPSSDEAQVAPLCPTLKILRSDFQMRTSCEVSVGGLRCSSKACIKEDVLAPASARINNDAP